MAVFIFNQFIYHIFSDKNGELKGNVYSFRNRQKKSETAVDSLSYKDRYLYMVIQTQVKMEYIGFLIRENQTIGGKLIYPNGSSVPWTLKRINIKSIQEISNQDSLKFNVKK